MRHLLYLPQQPRKTIQQTLQQMLHMAPRSGRHRSSCSFLGVLSVAFAASSLLGVTACNDLAGLAGTQSLPTGTPDPNSLRNPAGATQLYNAVIGVFGQGGVNPQGGVRSEGAFVQFTWNSGLLADEFTTNVPAGFPAASNDLLDARTDPPTGRGSEFSEQLYGTLQGIRGGAYEAIGSLAAYDDSAVALRGHLYALRGYAELFLADLFCSGVPLSTLDFNGSYTYHGPSTTAEIYQTAIADFDTALTLAGDSVRFLHLAQVGKGRAYLALAQYDSAAVAVAAVPDSFVYSLPVVWAGTSLNATGTFAGDPVVLANREGINGLPYLSNGDPRDAVQYAGPTNSTGDSVFWPLKYGGAQLASGVSKPVVVASGLEARLIQAEAAYQGVATGTGSWLQQLNTLRHDSATTASLPDLTDPGTSDSQVDLLFRERAYWLYVTGHRQGDLRRLIRNYNRQPNSVYPTGPYYLLSLGRYEQAVDVQIPLSESVNPLYQGCIARGA